jgi:hypothetical protein
LLEYISTGSGVLPLILGLLFLKRINNLTLRVIFIYIIYSLINDILILVLYDERVPLLIPLSLFTVIEYSLFSLYFYSLFESKSFKNFVIVASILFYSLAIVNFFFLGRSKKFDSLPATLESVLIIIYCIYYFYDQLNKPQVSFIYSTSHFWITIGIFIYLAGTFFLFVQASVLSDKERSSFWTINLISNIMKNILFSISFIIPTRPSNDEMKKPLHDNVFKVS